VLAGKRKKHVGSSSDDSPLQYATAGSLGEIIGSFKSVVAGRINQLRDAQAPGHGSVAIMSTSSVMIVN
jgi:hypothetical protein